MFDIALYGHLTVDRIFEGFETRNGLGSIANVWKELYNIDDSLKIHICPTDLGSAIVYIDKSTSERFSKAKLSSRYSPPNIQSSKINHVLYLNELHDASFIKSLNGIVCADVCVGKPIKTEYLQYIDYLLISDEDIIDYDFLKKNVKGKVLVHSSHGSSCDDFNYELPEEKILEDVNVLGAGDMFAAYFLYGLFKNKMLQDNIKTAHLKTTERLHEEI